MQEIKVDDMVKICSLDATGVFGINPHMRNMIGGEYPIAGNSHVANGLKIFCPETKYQYIFHVKDLELIPKQVEEEDEEGLSHAIKVGDVVNVSDVMDSFKAGLDFDMNEVVECDLVVAGISDGEVPTVFFKDKDSEILMSDLELVKTAEEVAKELKPASHTRAVGTLTMGQAKDAFIEGIDVYLVHNFFDDACEFIKDEYLEEKGNYSKYVGKDFIVTDYDLNDDTVEISGNGDTFWVESRQLSYDNPKVELEEETTEPAIYTITQDTVSLVFRGKTYNINKDNTNFGSVRQAVLEGRYDDAVAKVDAGQGIKAWSEGDLDIKDGEVLFNGENLSGKLVDRIIEMMGTSDMEFERFARFLVKVQEQTSYQTRQRLMDFVAAKQIKLTPEGGVIAFKNVNADYFDKHSGNFRNMVGDVCEMNRKDVDDNHDNTCSAGLHVCSPEYLKGFWGTSGKTMKVVVEPTDFVAIPPDYNDSKARVCKYTVVEDVTSNIQEYLDV